jgi:hypothetical protein
LRESFDWRETARHFFSNRELARLQAVTR